MNRLLTTHWLAAAFVCVPSLARAASVTVGSTCSMKNAVASVNFNTATGGCVKSGSGLINVINVPGGTFTENDELVVQRSVKILGAGRDSTTFVSGGATALLAHRGFGPLLEIRDMTVKKLSTQPLARAGIRADAPARLVLGNVRIADFNGVAGVWLHVGTGDSVQSTVTNSLVENNFVGIRQESGDLTVTGTTISGNRRGLELQPTSSGFMTIYESTIRNNTLPSGNGAGFYVTGGSGGQLRVYRSLIRDNRATTGDGGGAYSQGQVYFYNTTFTGNRATRGGGLHHVGAESYLFHTTFSANTGDSRAGGAFHDGGQSLWYFNIFANNTAPTNPDVEATFIAAKYNVVENSSGYTPFASSNDILNLDPKLGALANLGGPTLAFPLLAGSTAIDRIPSTESEALTTDQRNFSRPVNGPDGSGRNGFDIGAIEQR
jgi:hypothetical protein